MPYVGRCGLPGTRRACRWCRPYGMCRARCRRTRHRRPAANPRPDRPARLRAHAPDDLLTAGAGPVNRFRSADLAVLDERVWQLVLDVEVEVLSELMHERPRGRARRHEGPRQPGPHTSTRRGGGRCARRSARPPSPRIKEAVAQGTWAPVGSMRVEPETNMPGDEAPARQIVHGKRFFAEELGVETEEITRPDSSGSTAPAHSSRNWPECAGPSPRNSSRSTAAGMWWYGRPSPGAGAGRADARHRRVPPRGDRPSGTAAARIPPGFELRPFQILTLRLLMRPA